MPALASLSLKDSSAVSHSFTPRDVKDNTGLWVESTGTPVGEKRVTLSAKKSVRRYKPEGTVTVPVIVNEVINGVTVPRVDRVNRGRVAFDYDERSVTAERADVKTYVRELLLDTNSIPHAVFVGLEGIWG